MNALRGLRLDRLSSFDTTISLDRPFGRTLLLSLLILVLLVGASEAVARNRLFKAHFVARDWGSRHEQLEIQLGRLEMIAANEGAVECIFLGNSMVWRGFDAETFARVFNEETGRHMRCFNFGVDGMPAAGAGVVASILAQDYRPRYLIYGADARDFAVPPDARDAAVLRDTPWLRYRQGEFSLNGWLYEHAHTYRYWQSLAYLMRLERTYLFVGRRSGLSGDDYGFTPDNTVGEYVSSSPLEHLELGPVQYYLELLSNYEILPENVHGLEQIASLNGPNTKVILVEMPVPETYLEFFGNGEQDYDSFLQQVQKVAGANQISFWRTRPLQLFADDEWVDYSHLNTRGARTFSRWFARQLSASISQ